MTREELWLAAIAGLDGVNPPDYPVWHYEQMLAAIYDAVTGAADPRPFPERSWHLDEFLYAVYCAVAGLDDPGCPAPTCRIEEFWKGIHDAATGDDSASVPDPVWRIEEFLAGIFDVASGWGASVLTETGDAPLTLANAIARAIKSLTQTGLCTQAATPTPSAPVDIMCNNGALCMVDDELPSGYKRLLGISFDGNFHYETGEYLTGDDDVTMTLDNLSSSGKNVFGSYNGANDKNFSLYIYGSTNGSYFRYGDQLKRPKYGGTGKRTITFGASGTSGFAENSTVDPDEFTTPANACIGMLPNSSSSAFMGDIVGSILVSNRLEWIPCERESDGVIGYYEKYNGNFIAPSGSGTPVSIGYDTSHMTVLSIVGDAEVLTVSASGAADQTATVESLLAVGSVADEQNLINGVVIRRCAACCYDGTQTIGDVYMSTTGGKDLGAIIVYPLDEPVTELVTAQPLNTSEGTNTVSVTAEVSPVALTCEYYGASS